jgi:hypothetical protein
MAKQALAQINMIEDPAQLEQGLAQMQGMLSQVPPEIKPGLELVIKRASEKLEELKAAAGEEE